MKGSLLRCLTLTSLPSYRFAEVMESLVKPLKATVTPDSFYMPGGFHNPQEAQLHIAPGFLTAGQRDEVKRWWLKVHKGKMTTPNWDLVCQCEIQGNPGLILVEAKAHQGECGTGPKEITKDTNHKNHEHIGECITAASDALNKSKLTGWNLQRDSHYQLSNRFAWSWKLASMGIPVVLVYLGFLNASDMADKKTILLPGHSAWEQQVMAYSKGIVPKEVWNSDTALLVNNTPMWALIRSMELGFKAYGG